MSKSLKQKVVADGFSYNSGEIQNGKLVDSLREMIKEYVDPNFTV